MFELRNESFEFVLNLQPTTYSIPCHKPAISPLKSTAIAARRRKKLLERAQAYGQNFIHHFTLGIAADGIWAALLFAEQGAAGVVRATGARQSDRGSRLGAGAGCSRRYHHFPCPISPPGQQHRF